MVRRVGGAVRQSLREFGSILLTVCITKIVLIVSDVHYQLPVEVFMEAVIHLLATLIPRAVNSLKHVASFRLATEASLFLGACRLRSTVPIFQRPAVIIMVRFGTEDKRMNHRRMEE